MVIWVFWTNLMKLISALFWKTHRLGAWSLFPQHDISAPSHTSLYFNIQLRILTYKSVFQHTTQYFKYTSPYFRLFITWRYFGTTVVSAESSNCAWWEAEVLVLWYSGIIWGSWKQLSFCFQKFSWDEKQFLCQWYDMSNSCPQQ